MTLTPNPQDANRHSPAIRPWARRFAILKSKSRPSDHGSPHTDKTSANDKRTAGAASSEPSPAVDASDNPPPEAIAGYRSDTPATSTIRTGARPSRNAAPVLHSNVECYELARVRSDRDGTVAVTPRSLSPRAPTAARIECLPIAHPSPQRDLVRTPSESPLTDRDVGLARAQPQVEGHIDGTPSILSPPPVTSSSSRDDDSQLLPSPPAGIRGILSWVKRFFYSNTKPRHLADPLPLKKGLWNMLFLSWTNFLFPCVILSWVLHFAKDDDSRFSLIIITCSSLSLLFFATPLEFVADDLALRAGPTQAYLIWQLFDNSITVAFGILGLRKGEVDLTLSILAGSVAANTLLIPGVALAVDSFNGGSVGPYTHKRDLPILILSTLSLIIFVIMSYAVDASQNEHNGHLAGKSIICVVAIGLTLVFFGAVYHRARNYTGEDVDRMPPRRSQRKHRKYSQDLESGPEISQDQPHLSLAWALLFLAIFASGTAYTVEILTDAIHHSEDTIKVSTRLIGLVIVPAIRSIGDHLHITWSYEKSHIISTIAMCLSSSQLLVSTIFPFVVVLY